MPDPDITSHEQLLREIFKDNRDLSVHVARLSVLFEDLRLESSAARYQGPIEQLDTSGKHYRYFYFIRRLLVSIDEFAGALHQINANAEWKRLRKDFDPDTELRWDSAVKYFASYRKRYDDHRDSIGGHFKEKTAAFAIENLRPDSTGTIEI